MKSIDKYVLVLVASLALLLAGCGGGSSTTETEDSGSTAGEMAIMQAQTALTTAEAGLSGATTDAAMLAAYRAIQTAADNLVTALTTHGGSAADIAAAARKSGEAEAMADDLAEKIADAATEADKEMAAMAAKLWAGIGATPLANGTVVVADTGILTVTRVTPDTTDTDPAVPLMANKGATVASLHGWAGSEQTAKATADQQGGTYTARLYSDVEKPMQGARISTLLNNEGVIPSATLTNADNVANVDSPQFDQGAGAKEFELPDPNSSGVTIINIPGSYSGVGGTYSCDTGGTDGNTCEVTKAGEGFTLGGTGSTWSFTPTNSQDRVTGTPDTLYAVYGWWLHEAADGAATVSAFAGYRGTPVAVTIDGLNGTATYKGGAAGKYSIAAGATNDAGHFTADAELNAEFNGSNDHMISGTIRNFIGADGMSRDWSVALKEGTLGDDGAIAAVANGTTWTIGDSGGSATGSWSGQLREENSGGVPTDGVGTFHSAYGNTGRIVGAFGVDL